LRDYSTFFTPFSGSKHTLGIFAGIWYLFALIFFYFYLLFCQCLHCLVCQTMHMKLHHLPANLLTDRWNCGNTFLHIRSSSTCRKWSLKFWQFGIHGCLLNQIDFQKRKPVKQLLFQP
jgi:hypothetical protein